MSQVGIFNKLKNPIIMKKSILLIFFSFAVINLKSVAQGTFTVSISGLSYFPSVQTIKIGDKVTFPASDFHPLTEVTKDSWDANQGIPKVGGFANNTKTGFTKTFTVSGDYYYVCAAHVSGGMKGKIIVQSPLGIEGTESFSGDFKVYPNPTESNVSIDLNTISYVNSVVVLNSQGIEVMNSQVNLNLSIYNLDLHNLEAGLYQIVVATPTKKLYSKVVVR